MKQLFLLFAFLLISASTLAGVMPSQSRIIYRAGEKSQAIMLANTNSYPVVVQTWVDNGEGTPDTKNIPFLTAPSVFRLEASGIKGISVLYNNTPLPQDRESLFWLNILEIPPEKKSVLADNKILVGLNMQIKLFYRPRQIGITPEEAVKKITCQAITRRTIQCLNPSPVHISGIGLTNSTTNESLRSENNDYLFKPLSHKTFTSSRDVNTGSTLKIAYINDAGEQLSASVGVGPGADSLK